MSQTKAQLIDPVDGTIVNADINASAAIAGSKIAPDFGSQNIVTTGSITGNDLEIDSGTLSVDASNNRVGIGTTSPVGKLDIRGDANVGFEALRLTNTQHDTNNPASAQLKFGITMSSGERNARIEAKEASNNSNGVHLDFYPNSAGSANNEQHRMRLDELGMLIVMGNTTTVNSTPSQNGIIAYYETDQGNAHIGTYSSGGATNLSFVTNTGGNAFTTKMTIKNDGNVGIGTTSPSTKLQVSGGHINIGAGYSYQWGDSHERIEQSDGKIEFFTNNGQQVTLFGGNLGIGTVAPAEKLHVAGNIINTESVGSTGDSGIMLGSGHRLGFDQSGTRSWTIKATSGVLQIASGDGASAPRVAGLLFGSDTAAANTLDDYEEGTYTPSFGYATDDGNKSYLLQVGQYTKIGSLVNVNIAIQLNNRGTGSGAVTISLPFTVADVLSGTSIEASGQGRYFFGLASSVTSIGLLASHSSTNATLHGTLGNAASASSTLTYAFLGNNASFRFSITYRTT